MLFGSHKRTMRDRGVGLVFRWRGAKKYHQGKIYAFLITAACFAFALYALKVEGLQPPLLTKKTGRVIFLDPSNLDCKKVLMQVADLSPFPLRWDPAYDPESMGRVYAASGNLENLSRGYQPVLKAFPETGETERIKKLPSITSGKHTFFDGSTLSWNEAQPRENIEKNLQKIQIEALISGSPSIHLRLPTKNLALPNAMLSDDWFGQSFSFLVGLDEDGVVRDCLPLSSTRSKVAKPTEKQKLLVSWLYRVSFKPSEKKGMSVGVLKLAVKAKVK